MGLYLLMCLSEKIYGRKRSNYSCFATEWQIDGMRGVSYFAGLPTARTEKKSYIKTLIIEKFRFLPKQK
jgi:hypothetical protein